MSQKNPVTSLGWSRMVEICRRFYVQEETQASIARDLNLSPGTVSKLLKRARDLGVVRFHIEEEMNLSQRRLPEHENELQQLFQLDRAIVIDFPYDKNALGYQDDSLHQVLGYACADFLRGWLRSRDHIGVGGGRGAYYTAKHLADTAAHPLQRRLTHIRATSLTGSMSTTPWDSYMPIVDADQAAVALASAFKNATYIQLNAPVAPPKGHIDDYWEAGSARVLRLENWRGNPHEYVPNVGLVGVGALAGQHRFCKTGKHQLDTLAVLEEDLRQLLTVVKPSVEKGYYPVGDICNRLFFIEPIPGRHELDEEERSTIKRLVDELNKHILSVTEDHLRLIRSKGALIAVAGGKYKLDAISSLLTYKNDQPLTSNTLGVGITLNILCTDVTTADRLLRRARGQEDVF